MGDYRVYTVLSSGATGHRVVESGSAEDAGREVDGMPEVDSVVAVEEYTEGDINHPLRG